MKEQSKFSEIHNIAQNFPQCTNKKEARMVCLNQKCQKYAFFCLQCDDQSCEKQHRHENKEEKYVAISFKQFIRRVLKERKPLPELEDAAKKYQEILEKLKRDVTQFIEKQMEHLDEAMKKAIEVQHEEGRILKKLRVQEYKELLGKQMDYVWKKSGDSTQNKKYQEEMAQFLKVKSDELKAISEDFEKLTKMEFEKIEDQEKQEVVEKGKLGGVVDKKSQNSNAKVVKVEASKQASNKSAVGKR